MTGIRHIHLGAAAAAAIGLAGCGDLASLQQAQPGTSIQESALAVARDFGYGPGDIRVRPAAAQALQSLGPGRTPAESAERQAFREQFRPGDALVQWSTRLPRRTAAAGLAIVRDGRVVARIQTEFY